VDGAENNWPSYLTTSHFEVAKYLITDEHTRVPEIMVGSKRAFDKLSKADQELIKKAAMDSVAVQIKLWTDYEKVAEKAVRDKGAIITEVTPAEKAKFMAAMQPLYDKQPKDILVVVDKVRAVK
jgi:TRAP-type C4-dicarboxylate transport system substrate-binding protein